MDTVISKTYVPAVEVQAGDVVVVNETPRGVSWVGDKDHETFDVEVVVGRNEFEVVTFETAGNVQVVKVHPEGTHPCGVCSTGNGRAIDWGCQCGKTAEQINHEAHEFARIHD